MQQDPPTVKRKKFFGTRRKLLVLRFFTALSLTIGWIWFSGSISGAKYDFTIHDGLMRMRGAVAPPKDVVIIALDEATYSALELPMDRPIPRAYYGRALQKLSSLGAKRVVFDIVFAGQSSSPEGDDILAAGVGALPVVLGVDHGVQEKSGMLIHELIKPDPFLSERAGALAGVGMQVDHGAVRYFLFNKDQNSKELPTLSEAGAGIYSQASRPEEMPGPEDLINYYGPAGTVPTYSLYQLLEEQVPFPREKIENKVVYIGLVLRTGLGASQKDSFLTPFGDIFGVEIHATQAANLIEKNWINRPSRIQESLIGGILVFFLLMLLLRVKPQWAIAVLTVTIILWHIPAYLGTYFRFYLDGASAVTAIMPLAVIISATFWYLRTHKKSVEIERAFSLYLAPAMVLQLKRNPSLLKLGGEEIVASAIFTDIAGFTGISENLGPARVTAMLNAYFTEIGQVVMEEDGTLIKFIGDAVFALWGAPLPQEDHAARACRAALKIQKAVDNFNLRGEFPSLITRVGVHTGRMVVGNLGSNRRFDFTAIGDAVNLSSRVEGVNKYLGTTVLATDDALEAAKNNGNFEAPLLRMGAIKVIGREVPVSLFRLTEIPVNEEVSADWKKAIAAFTSRRWDISQSLFLSIQEREVALKIAADLYLSIIEKFKTNPPEASWRGELVMEHK